MKRALIYIGIAFGALSCAPGTFSPRTGDLLFQVNESSAMTDAITDATTAAEPLQFSHVAIALGPDSIIEASPKAGVRVTTLAEFLAASAQTDGRPAVVVMRMRGDRQTAKAGARRARSYTGLPYDFSYRPDNGRLYCSELVEVSFLDAGGKPLFPARPMNFRAADGTMPDFWAALFEELGEPIPEGVPGTNPADMARENCLEEVYRYF